MSMHGCIWHGWNVICFQLFLARCFSIFFGKMLFNCSIELFVWFGSTVANACCRCGANLCEMWMELFDWCKCS